MAKVDKNLTILIGIGIVLAIGVAVFAMSVQPEISDSMSASVVQIVQENSLVIDNGDGNVQTIEIRIKKGASAFDLLEKGTKKLDLELKTKIYEDVGIFIEAIGDRENGQDKKYWLYYVNGGMPSNAADKQPLKEGDKVEFKFEASPF